MIYRDSTESRIAAATAEVLRTGRHLEQTKVELREERFRTKFDRVGFMVIGIMLGLAYGVVAGATVGLAAVRDDLCVTTSSITGEIDASPKKLSRDQAR